MFERTPEEIEFLYQNQSHPVVIEYVETITSCLDKGIIDVPGITKAWQRVVDLMIRCHIKTKLVMQ